LFTVCTTLSCVIVSSAVSYNDDAYLKSSLNPVLQTMNNPVSSVAAKIKAIRGLCKPFAIFLQIKKADC